MVVGTPRRKDATEWPPAPVALRVRFALNAKMPFGEELWAFVTSRKMTPPPNLKLCAPAVFVSTPLNCFVEFLMEFGRFCESPSTAKPVMFISASPVAMSSTLTPWQAERRTEVRLVDVRREGLEGEVHQAALELADERGAEHPHVVGLIAGRGGAVSARRRYSCRQYSQG